MLNHTVLTYNILIINTLGYNRKKCDLCKIKDKIKGQYALLRTRNIHM